MITDRLNEFLIELGLPEYYIDSVQMIKFNENVCYVQTYEPTLEGYLKTTDGTPVLVTHTFLI